MSDRFKFRFWDEDFGYKFFELGDENPVDKCLNDEIEQCTGLWDKDGDLIYEGDIVKKVTEINGNFVDCVRENLIIKWHGYYWALAPIDRDIIQPHALILNSDETIKIIGNVHANPELLK
jgi:uncharacterized phage protein (TIGR01671 family)